MCKSTSLLTTGYSLFMMLQGDWDSMVLARVKNREDLDDLTKTVFTLEGISRSYTHVVLNTVKESGVILPEE